MLRYTVHFAGRVQGVGFRYTVCELAAGYLVAGTVQNLRDGRVRLVLEGDKSELDGLVTAVQQRMARNIKQTHMDSTATTGEFGLPEPGGISVVY